MARNHLNICSPTKTNEPENRLLVFFSGHGHTRWNGRKGYLVPADAPSPRDDERGFLQKALPMSQILA